MSKFKLYYLIQELIPLGCCKSVYYSNEYLKSYQCKLLGLSDQVNLFKSISKIEENNDSQIESNFSKAIGYLGATLQIIFV